MIAEQSVKDSICQRDIKKPKKYEKPNGVYTAIETIQVGEMLKNLRY